MAKKKATARAAAPTPVAEAQATAPDRADVVARVCRAHPEAFEGEGEAFDENRRRLLPELCRELNRFDGTREDPEPWGILVKTDRSPDFIPCDIVMWRPTREHIDALAGRAGGWENYGPPGDSRWIWARGEVATLADPGGRLPDDWQGRPEAQIPPPEPGGGEEPGGEEPGGEEPGQPQPEIAVAIAELRQKVDDLIAHALEQNGKLDAIGRDVAEALAIAKSIDEGVLKDATGNVGGVKTRVEEVAGQLANVVKDLGPLLRLMRAVRE